MTRWALVVAGIAVGFIGCSAPFRATVEITRPELQQRMDEKFPLEKRVLLAKLSLGNPKVLLDDGSDRVGLEMDAEVRLPLLVLPGKLGVLGRLHYDQDSGTFFLKDPEITQLEVPELPEEYNGPVREAATIVLNSQLPMIPVHQIEGPKKAFMKSVAVKDGKVLVEMGL